MNNFIIFNKLYFNKSIYSALDSKNLHNAILECLCKKYNMIYCIMENDNFQYYGSNYDNRFLTYVHIDNKKNFTVFLNIESIDYIFSKIYMNSKIENLFIFHSKLKLLNESYKDLYNKLLKNLNKKNNIYLYTSKIDEINIHFTNYIFDIIYISNYKFDNILNSIHNIESNISNFIIFNMNYFLFIDSGKIEDMLKVEDKYVYLCNNNEKYKNFMITNFKNCKNIKNLKQVYINYVNLSKIYN